MSGQSDFVLRRSATPSYWRSATGRSSDEVDVGRRLGPTHDRQGDWLATVGPGPRCKLVWLLTMLYFVLQSTLFAAASPFVRKRPRSRSSAL